MNFKTRATTITLLFAALAGGCNDGKKSEMEFYRSLDQCLSENYYSEATCRSSSFIIPRGIPYPEKRAYHNASDCLQDGFYSRSACENAFSDRQRGGDSSDDVNGAWNRYIFFSPR